MGILTLIFRFVAGWLIGTSINLAADQLPVERRFSTPYCAECGHRPGWFVYLFLEACPSCGAARSFRSLATPWLMGVAYALVDVWSPERLLIVEALALLAYFALVFIIDLEHRLILHPISLFGAGIGLAIGLRLHGPGATLLGGAAGFGLMFGLYLLGELFARFLARRRGEPLDEVALGYGDVNLSGVLGLLLGWPGIAAGLLLAIIAGGVVSGAYLLFMLARRQYRAFTALPYAPFLLLAAAVLLLRP